MSTALETVAERIRAGELEEAQRELDATVETDENGGQVEFLRGFLREMSYDREGALDCYEKVLDTDPDHTEAAFRAALLYDQGGADDKAVELYEMCKAESPAPINALINLAVLYEEHGDLERAESCLLDVLADFPNHTRAKAFLQSVESSYTMAFDEQRLRDRERRDAVLDVPISDFELSVRARNCLRQMNIKTLGDLLRTTEAELLSYKNFGETSLNEIKAMLDQKGLKLGQALQPAEQPVLAKPVTVSPDGRANFSRPVSELELSVRSRKALQRLGISTLGELSMRTEAELISIKNFGQTSLTEIKRQLGAHGMTLRQPG
ncbi:MAG: DNA-directed RNA polymerase subunit alpha C-terminal domain-containing protein [Phycisphaerae bacterium]|jgi:DNA-directed RNA polymerase subunit alpha